MAIAPLNEFKSLCFDLTTTPQDVLVVPVSVATIVLDSRIINITGTDGIPPLKGHATVTLTKGEDPNPDVIVVPNMEIPSNDALIFISGKFVMQEGDTLSVFADVDGTLQLLISYLETSA